MRLSSGGRLKPLIRAELLRADTVRVAPAEFLGPAAFKAYQDACRGAGGAYDHQLRAHSLRLDYLPALITALDGGFRVGIDVAVVRAAQSRASAILASRAEAAERIGQAADQPFAFQEVGIPWLAERQSGILGDVVGLGKTVQAVLAIADSRPALVICPGKAKKVWRQATQRWRPGRRWAILDTFRWPEPGETVIINYERLPNEKVPIPLPPPGVALIADEAHYLSHYSAQRTKNFRRLRRAVVIAGGSSWALSGTPMTNNPVNLLGVLQSFDLLKESFGSYPRFMYLANGKQDYWGKWKFGDPRPGYTEALQRVMLRRLAEDVRTDMPPVLYADPIEVDIPAAARRASDEARTAMAAAGVDWASIANGTKTLGASQEHVFTARRLIAEAKIPAVIEVAHEYLEAKEPLLIFSAHRAPIEALRHVAGCRVIMGGEETDAFDVAEAFQRGDFMILAATIRAGGDALTMTRAAHVVFVDEEFAPHWNEQAVGRVNRIGQTRSILVKRLLAIGTVDEDHASSLVEKRSTIKASVDQTEGQAFTVNPADLMALERYLHEDAPR